MENKKKKGFTLIELLAIIVILAIIAVITVPIILNVIENSKKGAASDSAYGFKDSVNKYYVSELSKNPDYGVLNGEYTVTNGTLTKVGTSDVLTIESEGTTQKSGSLTYENNKLTGGCLVIDDYAVTFGANGSVTSTVKGTCSSSNQQGGNTPSQSIVQLYDSTKTTQKTIDNIAVGDMATIDDQGFEVINPNKNGNVVLLAEYNLKEQEESNTTAYIQPTNGIMLMSNRTYLVDNTTVWKQYSGARDALDTYYKTRFSEDIYWYDVIDTINTCVASGENECYEGEPEAEVYGCSPDYETDSEGYKYVYGTRENEQSPYTADTANDLVTAINGYKSYLQGKGANIEDVRLMSYAEANSLSGVQRLINNQIYWLGSEYGGTARNCETRDVWIVEPGSGSFANQGFITGRDHQSFDSGGVRPVIEISRSEF